MWRVHTEFRGARTPHLVFLPPLEPPPWSPASAAPKNVTQVPPFLCPSPSTAPTSLRIGSQVLLVAHRALHDLPHPPLPSPPSPLSPLQPHGEASHCPPKTPDAVLSQGLCRCSAFCLAHLPSQDAVGPLTQTQLFPSCRAPLPSVPHAPPPWAWGHSLHAP